MGNMVCDLDTLIHALVTTEGDPPSIASICDANRISPNELYNTTALEIARRFDNERMSYEDADAAMNTIWIMMIENISREGDGSELAEPAYSIYEAFDAGEYDHGDGENPVERYTKPAIKRILAEV